MLWEVVRLCLRVLLVQARLLQWQPVVVDHQHVSVAVLDAPPAKTQQQQELCTPSSFSWERLCQPSCLRQESLIS